MIEIRARLFAARVESFSSAHSRAKLARAIKDMIDGSFV